MCFVFVENIESLQPGQKRYFKISVPGMRWFNERETKIIGRRLATILSDFIDKKLVFEKIEERGGA